MPHNNPHPRHLSGFQGRVFGGHVGPMRGHAYGSEKPPRMPWVTDRDNDDPTPGTSGAAAAPGAAHDNDDDTNEGGEHVNDLESPMYKVYRDRGESHEEAEAAAAAAAGVPPKSLRARMGWAPAEPGSVSALEQEMWHSFKNRGHSADEAARLARAWVSR